MKSIIEERRKENKFNTCMIRYKNKDGDIGYINLSAYAFMHFYKQKGLLQLYDTDNELVCQFENIAEVRHCK